MEYYTVYKITNLVNNKIYIGAHKTSDLDDGYMGSGKYISSSQKKHGLENFEKEILRLCETEEEMYLFEKELVTKDFIKSDTNYNLKEGGEGGFDHINNDMEFRIAKNQKARRIANENGATIKAHQRLKWLRENDSDWEHNRAIKFSKTMKERYGEDAFKTFKGKNHSDETKRKISESHKSKGYHKGENNSSFGTVWVSNLELRVSYKIKKEELLETLKNPNIIKKGIRDFEKYFLEIENKKKSVLVKEQHKLEKSQERIKLAMKFQSIKEDKKFKSLRELHSHLKDVDLFNHSEEALRRLLQEL